MASPPQKVYLDVIQDGDKSSQHPYTIAIVANPALETPIGSSTFVVDPIISDRPLFDAAALYTFNVLFGRLPGQLEKILNDPLIGPRIRVVKLFVSGLPADDSNSLVGHYGREITESRRDAFKPFLSRYGITADVAYAITNSSTHKRASAWYTTDDHSLGGVAFNSDGTKMLHSYYCSVPGTVAQHASSHSMTGLHEFGHACSSFTDGAITDQYVDSLPDLNVKRGRPIPSNFGTMDGTVYDSDLLRDGLGYDAGWLSYHPKLVNPLVPSLMDNYWRATPPNTPEQCVFDTITAAFIRARLLAKLSR